MEKWAGKTVWRKVVEGIDRVLDSWGREGSEVTMNKWKRKAKERGRIIGKGIGEDSKSDGMRKV